VGFKRIAGCTIFRGSSGGKQSGAQGGVGALRGLVIALGPFLFGVSTVLGRSAALLMLAASFVAGLTLMAVRSPKFLWVIYFVALCANGLSVRVGSATLRPEFFALPILGLAVLSHSHKPRATNSFHQTRVMLPAALCCWLLFSVLTSALHAPEPFRSLWMTSQLGLSALSAWAVSRLQLDGRFMFNAGTWILGAISFVGVIAYLLKVGFGVDSILTSGMNSFQQGVPQQSAETRLVGLALEPNIMGSLAVGWLGAIYYQRRVAGLHSRTLLLPTGAIAIAAMLSGTRGAWFAMAAMAAIVLIGSVKRVAAGATIFGLILAAILLFLRSLIVEAANMDQTGWAWRATHVLDYSAGTGLYRVDMWKTAISELGSQGHSWFVGSGTNTFGEFHQLDATGVSAPYLSSLWVGVLYDGGLVGVVLFALVVIAVIMRLPRLDAAIPMLVGLAICATFTNLIWFAYPWVFVALVSKIGEETARETAGVEVSHCGSSVALPGRIEPNRTMSRHI
jgi:hypothetical protein